MEAFFQKLEKNYNFKLLQSPRPLSGGFMHKMYAIKTTSGDYALKCLNPSVMKRETAMHNFAEAERLERLLEEKNIPILPALSFGGKKLQEMDGQYFYLFDYYDGSALRPEEIRVFHCGGMGAVLAAIHGIDRKKADETPEVMQIDWDFYLAETEKKDRRLYELLRANYALILESQEKGNRAKKNLPEITAICHNDMDCKNVLWRGAEYRLIDLECLSYRNPMRELFELALCWSGYEECAIDFSRFHAFFAGYVRAGGALPDDWEVLYDSNNGRLEWLEYNLKRALGIDCGEEETALGVGQVLETIKHISYYAEVREELLAECRKLKIV